MLATAGFVVANMYNKGKLCMARWAGVQPMTLQLVLLQCGICHSLTCDVDGADDWLLLDRAAAAVGVGGWD